VAQSVGDSAVVPARRATLPATPYVSWGTHAHRKGLKARRATLPPTPPRRIFDPHVSVGTRTIITDRNKPAGRHFFRCRTRCRATQGYCHTVKAASPCTIRTLPHARALFALPACAKSNYRDPEALCKGFGGQAAYPPELRHLYDASNPAQTCPLLFAILFRPKAVKKL
jgi:hypothetical protein